MSFINLSGKLLSEAKATVSVSNRSFRYGDGCFETMRLVNGKLPLWPYHWQRLNHALGVLQFQPPSFFTDNYLQEQIISLAQKNSHTASARIRLTIFRGNGGLYDPENHFPNYCIQSWLLNDAVPTFNNNGLELCLYTGGFKAADDLARLKSNNYLLYAMAALYAKQQHCNDALVLNHRGSIADSTIANLFLIKENILLTPPLTDGPVAGTMRRYLLEKADSQGYSIQEQSLLPEDIATADEVFLTNAVYGIKWVKQFQQKQYGNRQAAQLFRQVIEPLLADR